MIERKQSTKHSEIVTYGIGVLLSILTMFVLLCISAICINNEYLNLADFGLVAVAIQILSCCLGGIIAGMRVGTHKKISTLVVSGGVVIVQFIVGLLLLDGFQGGILRLVIGAVIASVLGYLLAVVKERRLSGRRKKKVRR